MKNDNTNSQYYMAEYLYSIIRTSNTFNVYSNIDEVEQILTIKKNQRDRLRKNITKSIIKVCR